MATTTLAEALRLAYAPMAVLHTDEKPEGALQLVEGKRGCGVALVTAAAKAGKTAVFDRGTCGCQGGLVGLGFGRDNYAGMPGGIEYFLSTGRGEGYPEGESYIKTPELAREFVEAMPADEVATRYLVYRPLADVPEGQTPEVVVLYVNPDQLSAVVFLANYDRGGIDNVIIPMASGCQAIGILPLHESRQPRPRAVVGLIDCTVRPMVDARLLTVAIPYAMYREMEANIPGSFLEKKVWAKIAERIDAQG